jgi:HAD superfamily hydrolase (TIGR01490 family)
MALALFDLDNTLLQGDSDHKWGEFLVRHQLVDPQVYPQANDWFLQQYESGNLDIVAYLEFALQVLTRFSHSELDQLHQQFMQESILPMILPKGQQLLDQHRQAGDTLVIITATNDFVTTPIAHHLRVEHLLATCAQRNQHGYTGKVTNIPCFQDGKVRRLQQWLISQQNGNLNLAEAYFYSDSHNDLALLQAVGHPVAVDADAILHAYATQCGWPQISLRS